MRELTDKEAFDLLYKSGSDKDFIIAAKGAIAAGYVKAWLDKKGELQITITEQGKHDVEKWMKDAK